MMWKALVRVEIQLEKQPRVDRGAAAGDQLEIPAQIRSVEGPDDVARQRLERRRLAPAEVPARQPVMPGAIRKLLDGEAVDLLDLGGEVVLLEELPGGGA